MKKIVIIGGGAAGLQAACSAAFRLKGVPHSITIIEKNERPARKVMITGKGRCNVTNNCDIDTLISNTPGGGRFLYSAFTSFPPREVMAFFESLRVPLKTERGNRVFPVSDKAVDIVDALVKTVRAHKVNIICGTAEEILQENGRVTGVTLRDGQTLPADSVILATGGLSYPLTGSTGDGYEMARRLGHTVTELSPSLVPLVCHEGFCERLSGLSLKNVTLSVYEEGKKKPVYSELGEMLFTHFGISGPLVLSASAHMRKMGKKTYSAVIDLKPALSPEQLDKRILRDFSENTNRSLSNSLDKLLPKSLIPVIIALSGIESTLKVNQITRQQRAALVTAIKGLCLHIKGFRPIEEAIVTRGGIKLKEIDPSTMQSKLIKGLFFAGEIIDVDAYTGGFNLQIAFSTGFLAGEGAAKYEGEPDMISVAIDGPAGAGKSSLARLAAKELGFLYVDTGALYRTIALGLLRAGVDDKDHAAVENQLSKIKVDLMFNEQGEQRVFLGDEDVSDKIRTPEVSMMASSSSAIPAVRAFLLDKQRRLAKNNDVLMDGRDIGTVVLPNATVKIFLTASPEERARRRFLELQAKGTPDTYEQVYEDMVKRDYNDSHRTIAPLKPAEDSVIVDTTGLEIEQSLELIVKTVRERI